jgi:hypothetical protein
VPIWQVVILVWLGLVLVLGLGSLVAERRGWIKSDRLRTMIRRAYRLDRDDRKDIDTHSDE